MATLSFRGVQKSYRSGSRSAPELSMVLHGVDLEVADGEFIALVGPSGCGKSTLLRCVAGLEEITAGDLLIGERKVNDVAPKDRDVAMVFQSYALYPHLTVKENMAFALRLQKHPETEARVAEAAEMLGLTPLLARLPKELSGGQRQRVAMGRAIVRRPAVFLFDEPLSNLDAALRQQMRSELRRRHKLLRTTTLYVTHDQVEALTLADRIVVLNGGVVQQVGTPDELYFDPANRFVAKFIGSPTMNFLEHDPGRPLKPGQQADNQTAPPGEVIGVRPNDVVVHRDGQPDHGLPDPGLAATVEFVERLGFEAMVHLRVAGGAPAAGGAQDPLLMARVEGEAPSPGESVSLTFTRSYRFETATGARVRR
ncbi:MAG: ATP-binding cassette domain-containing protein [Myxococcales bacterium]|nr:ATP-binding cassette domain-containing protein [Myxococcales bacterium]